MALRYAVANGSWSNTATWNGGTLPTSADDVYSNNFTVNINQDITVLSINNSASTPAVAGGGYTININNITITSNINYTPATCLIASQSGILTVIGNVTSVNVTTGIFGISLNSTGTVNITGNITSGGGTAGYALNNTSNGLFNITGNVTGGTGNNSRAIVNSNSSRINVTGIITGGIGSGCIGILNSSTSTSAVIINGTCISSVSSAVENNSTGTVVINGTQTAVGTAGIYAINNSSAGIITINGDILGALSSAPSTAYIVNNGGTGIVNINGNVTARSVSPSTSVGIVNNSGTGTMNISQNVSGGSVANTIGVSNNTGTINVTGNITGGTHATNTPAIFSTTAGTIDVTGSATAGLYPALWATSLTATNILRGNITNALGVPAYNAYKITVSPTAVQTATMQDTGNIDRLFSTSNVSVGAPAVTNVRAGVVYGSTNELTGTMIVPTPGNVRKGVLTDATVGTAELTIAEFWDTDVSALTTTNSIGARLKNSSTVAVTGDQIAGFNV